MYLIESLQASSSSASLFAKDTATVSNAAVASTTSATDHLSGVEAAKQFLRNFVLHLGIGIG